MVTTVLRSARVCLLPPLTYRGEGEGGSAGSDGDDDEVVWTGPTEKEMFRQALGRYIVRRNLRPLPPVACGHAMLTPTTALLKSHILHPVCVCVCFRHPLPQPRITPGGGRRRRSGAGPFGALGVRARAAGERQDPPPAAHLPRPA